MIAVGVAKMVTTVTVVVYNIQYVELKWEKDMEGRWQEHIMV
ncbi:hypothetical protein Hanom_Chr07g00589931 [Helianthus anomalus]